MLSFRYVARPLVTLAFAAALGSAAWLDRHAPEATDSNDSTRLAFDFTEVSTRSGVQFQHKTPVLDAKLDNIMAHVAGIGAAVSVTDVNRDGWPDLYAVRSGIGSLNSLFLNQRDGTFRDIAMEAGVAEVNRRGTGASMGSIWADVDNDGDSDLFVYKWGYQSLFRNEGDGTFTDISEAAGVSRWMNSNGAVFFDFDRDGWLDLYLSAYFHEDHDLWNLDTTRIMQESFEFANNGGRNRLLRNVGHGKYRDVTEEYGVGSTRWTLAAAAADFDDDGWPDLYLANDYGPEQLFFNREGERFELASDIGLADDSKSGMSVALGDIRNRGRLAVYVTNISRPGYLFQGNNLRLNDLRETGRFDNIARGNVADCGWSWGSQFGDLDNDGWQDLVVLNGFISQNPDRDYWYGMSKVASGLSSIFENAANWPPIEDRSLSGYERSRILWNRNGQHFRDVAEAVGVDDRYDGRALALADLWNRGCLDLIVANQGGPLLLYRNEADPAHHWIKFDLATRDGSPAIGAEVRLFFREGEQLQVVGAGTGFSAQNDWRPHFGVGEQTQGVTAEIRWPRSGERQRLEGLDVDTIHRFEEPLP